jgi:hypothetical protein
MVQRSASDATSDSTIVAPDPQLPLPSLAATMSGVKPASLARLTLAFCSSSSSAAATLPVNNASNAPVHGMKSWIDNSNNRWIADGSYNKLYI